MHSLSLVLQLEMLKNNGNGGNSGKFGASVPNEQLREALLREKSIATVEHGVECRKFYFKKKVSGLSFVSLYRNRYRCQ